MIHSIQWDGKPIGLPGIYAGVPIRTYHRAGLCSEFHVSSTGLRRMWKSPAHYWVSSPHNPKRIEEEVSEAAVLGGAAHHLILGEQHFRSIYTIHPEFYGYRDNKPWKWHGNRDSCKTWIANAERKGLTVLSEDQVERIKGMANALMAHPLVRAGILNGHIERSFVWKDAETGLWLCARPDAIPRDSADFADLKTAAAVHDEWIRWAIQGREGEPGGYIMQAALVRMGCRTLMDLELASFSYVFIESKPPHCVRVKTLRHEALDVGERQCRAMIRQLADCLSTNKWPGPGGEETDASYVGIDSRRAREIDYRLGTGKGGANDGDE